MRNTPPKKSSDKKNSRYKGKKKFYSKKNSHHKNNKRNFRPHNQSKGSGGNQLLKKYSHLLEQYLFGRRKFFEAVGKFSGKKLDAIKRKYFHALKSLRQFETNLSPKEYQSLEKSLGDYAPDHYYSQSNNLDSKPVKVDLQLSDDPHFNDEQKSRPSYQCDTEESVGTMEELQAYKDSK